MKRVRHQTPAIILMREHYRQNGLDKGWTWEQVTNLCALMKITEYELFALYSEGTRSVKRYRTVGKVPPSLAIHFQILKGWYIQKTIGTEPKPVVPADLVVFEP